MGQGWFTFVARMLLFVLCFMCVLHNNLVDNKCPQYLSHHSQSIQVKSTSTLEIIVVFKLMPASYAIVVSYRLYKMFLTLQKYKKNHYH